MDEWMRGLSSKLANIQRVEIDARADRGTRQYNLGGLRAADRQRTVQEKFWDHTYRHAFTAWISDIASISRNFICW